MKLYVNCNVCLKARTKRRYVLGLREVTKHLKMHKLKCVIISPNLERVQSKGRVMKWHPLSSLLNCYVCIVVLVYVHIVTISVTIINNIGICSHELLFVLCCVVLTPKNLCGTWRCICLPDIGSINALEVLHNHAVQIDIYLLTYFVLPLCLIA